MVEDTPIEPLRGSTSFGAETSRDPALVELDLSGEVLAEAGDALLLNAEFQSVLTTSTGWSDAHVLMFALAGTPAAEAQAMAELMLASAVPSPRGTKSILAMGAACGTSAVTCTLAATWFPPLAGPCVKESVLCGGAVAFAIGCAVYSCED